MHFTNISSSNFAIAKYLKDIDQHIKVNIRWYSNETFRKLISNINPLLNNSVDVFLHKSEELYRDSIKGIKLGFTGFNLLWHHVMKISEFWLELPTYIYDDHNSNTLEDDEKNATKLKSIAKYSMAVNEYFKYAFKNISGLFGCFEETNSTKGVCGENGKSKLWWGVDFIYQRLHKYIQMIKTEQIEESCRLLFNPNFRNLTSYINGNQYYFKMHLPQLLQIFVRYLQNFWPYYLQSFEEQSRMKCQASYATTETAESS
ncbi:unnamed protein product [Heterobilharzia americana]|nr:unnamed protein product [Heterobilharzia americana]